MTKNDPLCPNIAGNPKGIFPLMMMWYNMVDCWPSVHKLSWKDDNHIKFMVESPRYVSHEVLINIKYSPVLVCFNFEQWNTMLCLVGYVLLSQTSVAIFSSSCVTWARDLQVDWLATNQNQLSTSYSWFVLWHWEQVCICCPSMNICSS